MISQAVGVRFLNVFTSLDLSMAKLRQKQDTKSKTMARGGKGYDEIFWSALYSFITRKNQVFVLTFWISKQNVEKHIETGIFS